jgi:putative hydrolase of the HAD superfamily
MQWGLEESGAGRRNAAMETPADAKIRPKTDLAEREVWLFDLDNTLYPASCRLFDQVDRNITRYIAEHLDLAWEDAYRMQKGFFRQHGTTMRGLMTEYGTDPDHFLEYVHDIDLSPVEENPALDRALAKLKGRKIIFTNGSVAHAEGIMKKLGVAHHFEAVFDIVASDYRPKPEPDVYDKLVSMHAINAPAAVMVEDMARNLKPAHDLGMACVWVRTESQWAQESSEAEHVHHIVDDLTQWLRELTGA